MPGPEPAGPEPAGPATAGLDPATAAPVGPTPSEQARADHRTAERSAPGQRPAEPSDARSSPRAPHTRTGADDEPRPGRRLVFAIVSVALFMGSMDQTIVATALNAIQQDLRTQINWSGWTITIYSLGQIVVMPLAGRLSDQYGRKRVFVLAAAVFTVASLGCGLVDNIYALIALRALQALGGGAFMPSATGIVAEQFGRDRDRAIGMFTSIFPIGGIVGPVVGGILVGTWSWRGVFLLNVPMGLLLIVLAVTFIPHTPRAAGARTDLRGIALLAAVILAAMFGITSLGGGASLTDPVFLGCEAFAVVAAWLFIWHTKRHAAPFIPLQLLRGRGLGTLHLINLLFGSAALGFGALVPLYAEQRFGISPFEAGILLTARAVGMICVAGLAVLALRRTGYRMPMAVGFCVVVVGLVGMAMDPVGVSAYVWLAVAAALTGLGMGFAVPAANNAGMQLAPDQVAAVAGLRGMFRQSGSIMAVSVTTAVLAQSSSPGVTQAHVFVVFAAVLVCVVPLTWLVPEHRGTW